MGPFVKLAYDKQEGTDVLTVYPLIGLLFKLFPEITKRSFEGVVYSEMFHKWFWSERDYYFTKGEAWGKFVQNSDTQTTGELMTPGVGQLNSVRGFDLQALVDKMALNYPRSDVVAVFDFNPEDMARIISRLPGVEPYLATSEVIFFECRSAKKADQLALAMDRSGVRTAVYSLGVRVSE